MFAVAHSVSPGPARRRDFASGSLGGVVHAVPVGGVRRRRGHRRLAMRLRRLALTRRRLNQPLLQIFVGGQFSHQQI